jgi:hypothetical protein
MFYVVLDQNAIRPNIIRRNVGMYTKRFLDEKVVT